MSSLMLVRVMSFGFWGTPLFQIRFRDNILFLTEVKVMITDCTFFNFYVYLCENSVFFKYRRVIFNFKMHMKKS